MPPAGPAGADDGDAGGLEEPAHRRGGRFARARECPILGAGGAREIDVTTYLSAAGRRGHRKAALLKDLQHAPVLGQDVSRERLDAVLARHLHQQLQHPGAEAAAAESVDP